MSKQKLSVIQLFSGVGFQMMGIRDSGLYDIESVATCDLDNDAVIAYAAVHCGMTPEMVANYEYPSRKEMADELTRLNMGFDFKESKPYDWQKWVNGSSKMLNKVWLACKLSRNLGDINAVKKLPKADLITYSFPCTSISVSGKMKGFTEEGESHLVFEFLRLMHAYDAHEMPKFLIMENVKSLVSKRFKDTFDEICAVIDDLGYNNYYEVLNAKYTGVPQARERVFMVSIRKDIDNGRFEFAKPYDNGTRLKDVLEENPDEKLYLNTPKTQQLINELITNGSLADYDE